MFIKVLTQAGHTRRFTISEAARLGWELRVEEDSTVVRRVCYTDWHRVERALSAIAEQVATLEEAGWRELVTTG
jgi:hypothetical protein